MTLEINDLHVSVEGKDILNGINLVIKPGEVHALMGPNGSGKTTLAYTIAGHPRYKIESGCIKLDNKEINELKPNERTNLGLFLAFQYPVEVQGVNLSHFLYNIAKTRDKNINPIEFRKELLEKIKLLDVDSSFLNRELNLGFSGGEKKKAEILQMLTLKPKFAILDETDSGTDVDSLKIISNTIAEVAKKENIGILIITHYNRILDYVKPNNVHVIVDGKIIKSGKEELAQEIEVRGYKEI